VGQVDFSAHQGIHETTRHAMTESQKNFPPEPETTKNKKKNGNQKIHPPQDLWRTPCLRTGEGRCGMGDCGEKGKAGSLDKSG